MSKEYAEKVNKIPMVFMVGHGRSGTTLLQALMNIHPNMVAPPESEFVIFLYPRFGKIKQWVKSDVIEFVDALFFDPLFYMWKLEREQLIQKFSSAMGYLSYPLICKMVFYEMGKGKENIMILSDKKPLYSLFIPKLLKIFPEAKFIHVVRDPRDSVSAHIKRLKIKNTAFLAWRWLAYNKLIETAKKAMPEKFFTVIYEKMVSDLEVTLHLLYEFLKVPYSPPTIKQNEPENYELVLKSTFYKDLAPFKQKAIVDRLSSIYGGQYKPVNTGSIAKWKTEMSPEDIAFTEKISLAYADTTYGYKTEPEKNKVKVSGYWIMRNRILYGVWQLFTKMRYGNYSFNKWYVNKTMFAITHKNKTILQ